MGCWTATIWLIYDVGEPIFSENARKTRENTFLGIEFGLFWSHLKSQGTDLAVWVEDSVMGTVRMCGYRAYVLCRNGEFGA